MSIINIKHIIISLKIFRKILLDISNNNGKIIFVGTLPKHSAMIKNLAQDLKQSYVSYKIYLSY
jgi:ribosomal protein S2